MGIQGLLPLLKPIQTQTHISCFKGQRLAVDGFAWLHKAAHTCAEELALNKPTDRYLQWIMRKVDFLQGCGVEVLIVFDGGALPSKQDTDEKRRLSRNVARQEGVALLSRNRKAEAQQQFQKAVRITHEMVHEITETLKRRHIGFVVAPYEADAQLVFLEKSGYVNGIISEDSDLVVYGAQMLVTKLDPYGACVTVNGSQISRCHELSLGENVSLEKLRYMAILSGCDYCDGVPRVGLKKAARFIMRWKTPESIIKAMRIEGFPTPPDFLDKFDAANSTFLYQRVYCPEGRQLVHLNEPESQLDDMVDYHIGAKLPNGLSRAIAIGVLHPRTHKPFETKKDKTIKGFFAPKDQYVPDVKKLPEANRSKPIARAPEVSQRSTPPIPTTSAPTAPTPARLKTEAPELTASHFFLPSSPEPQFIDTNMSAVLSSELDRSDEDIEESTLFGPPQLPKTPMVNLKRKNLDMFKFSCSPESHTPKKQATGPGSRKVLTPVSMSEANKRCDSKATVSVEVSPLKERTENKMHPASGSKQSLMRFAYTG